ncbi:MAG TPA: HyaD/HybD family hydrogenase maturation endopeptidase [Gemmatimonadaceae bacterium]|nr:HyaD/HybD family hydrogenase maturation endopeptidase [Gemmatimonadaceae bacterium]
MPTAERDGRDLVIGLGNPLMGDDGIGLAALERLQAEWEVPPEVELIDGGTWGMNLLPMIEVAPRVLFLDAIRAGLPPGSDVVLYDRQIPRVLAQKLSPHQIDLKEVLAVAELRGTLPSASVAIGLEPEIVELGIGLSPRVEAGIGRMVEAAVAQLNAWGHVCHRYQGVEAALDA